MNLTRLEKQTARNLLNSGLSKERVVEFIKKYRIERQQALKNIPDEDGILFGEKSLTSAIGDAGKSAISGFGKAYDRVVESENILETGLNVARTPLTVLAGAGRGFGEVVGGVLETADDLTGEVVSGAIQEPLADLMTSDFAKNIETRFSKADKFTDGSLGETLDASMLLGVRPSITALGKVGEQVGKVKERVGSLKDFMGEKTPEKLAAEILQPSTAVVGKEIAKGKIPAQVSALVENVKISKDFPELITNLKNVNKANFKLIDDIIDKDNFNIDKSYLQPLKDLIKNDTKANIRDENEIKKMREILKKQEDNLKKTGGIISRKDAQALKKELGKIVEPLQKKFATGTADALESAKLVAWDKVRDGLKIAVEGSDETIKNLNSKYIGIKQAIDSLSKRAVNVSKTIEPTFLQKTVAPVIELFSESTGAGSAAFVGKQALKLEKDLEKLTKELLKKSGQFKNQKTSIKQSKPPKSQPLKGEHKPVQLSREKGEKSSYKNLNIKEILKKAQDLKTKLGKDHKITKEITKLEKDLIKQKTLLKIVTDKKSIENLQNKIGLILLSINEIIKSNQNVLK